LAYLWHKQGVFAIQDVLTRSQASADEAVQFIGAGKAVASLEEMRLADVWMLAVPDSQIRSTASQLAEHAPKIEVKMALAGVSYTKSAIIFHSSGALSSDELQPLKAVGYPTASAHCILSFSAPASAITQFSGTPCALEGDELATSALKLVFEKLGANCFAVAKKDKILYHAAAVFATNFLPVLQVVAADLWRSSGMPEHLISTLNASLLQKAVQNISTQGAAKALTGPAARGDAALVALQGNAVASWDEQAGVAYAALSELAMRIAKDGTIQKTIENNSTKGKSI
jgi:predicted short-subunit dehydrogenase-like oxidoreductase (DUF2520 family)